MTGDGETLDAGPLREFIVHSHPDIRIRDLISMNTPFSGRCDGQIFPISHPLMVLADDCGLGKTVCGYLFILTSLAFLVSDNGGETSNGSYGSPIINEEGPMVSLFRY